MDQNKPAQPEETKPQEGATADPAAAAPSAPAPAESSPTPSTEETPKSAEAEPSGASKPSEPVSGTSDTPPPPADPSATPPTPPAGTPPATPNTPVTPAAQPSKRKRNVPLIVGALVVVILVITGAYVMLFSKTNPLTKAVQPPHTAVQTQSQATPTKTTTQEINSVDVGATNSSDMQQTQKDINGL